MFNTLLRKRCSWGSQKCRTGLVVCLINKALTYEMKMSSIIWACLGIVDIIRLVHCGQNFPITIIQIS